MVKKCLTRRVTKQEVIQIDHELSQERRGKRKWEEQQRWVRWTGLWSARRNVEREEEERVWRSIAHNSNPCSAPVRVDMHKDYVRNIYQ